VFLCFLECLCIWCKGNKLCCNPFIVVFCSFFHLLIAFFALNIFILVTNYDHFQSEWNALSRLMSNFFAQPDALAYGKTLNDLVQEDIPEDLRQHKVFPGNRPSSSILMTKLDAFAVGQLLAIFEHRTAVQGFIWGINSFDQYGTELGVAMAKRVRAQLSASRRRGASVQGFNSSTGYLLDAYLSHGRVSR